MLCYKALPKTGGSIRKILFLICAVCVWIELCISYEIKHALAWLLKNTNVYLTISSTDIKKP